MEFADYSKQKNLAEGWAGAETILSSQVLHLGQGLRLLALAAPREDAFV